MVELVIWHDIRVGTVNLLWANFVEKPSYIKRVYHTWWKWWKKQILFMIQATKLRAKSASHRMSNSNDHLSRGILDSRFFEESHSFWLNTLLREYSWFDLLVGEPHLSWSAESYHIQVGCRPQIWKISRSWSIKLMSKLKRELSSFGFRTDLWFLKPENIHHI